MQYSSKKLMIGVFHLGDLKKLMMMSKNQSFSPSGSSSTAAVSSGFLVDILNMSTKKPGDTATATEEEPEGENDWFFDIIINFLRSPRWKTPIMSLLDEYCIIFDHEDENKLEYTPIHLNFKKLVEELIGELLAELEVD
jgi:hypothetical protein